MRRQRIYISGPISDRPLAEACEHFSKAEAELRRHGFRTVNPLKMRMAVWLARHGCYRLCLLIELAWMAYTCPVVYMLENWQQSGGGAGGEIPRHGARQENPLRELCAEGRA